MPRADRRAVFVDEPALRFVKHGPPPLVRAVGQVQVFRVERGVQRVETAQCQVLGPGHRHGGPVGVEGECTAFSLGLAFRPPQPQQSAVHGAPHETAAGTPVPGLVNPGIDGEHPLVTEMGKEGIQEGAGGDDVVIEQDHNLVRSP